MHIEENEIVLKHNFNTKGKEDDDEEDNIYLGSSISTTSKTIQGKLQFSSVLHIIFVEIKVNFKKPTLK